MIDYKSVFDALDRDIHRRMDDIGKMADDLTAERDRLREINAELLAALKLIRASAQIGRMRTYDLMDIVDPAITKAEAGK